MFASYAYLVIAGARRALIAALVIGCVIALWPGAAAAAAKQRTFASPEDAAKELLAAVKGGDKKAMLEILGAEAKPVIDSGDAVADKEAGARFTKAYEEANKIEKSGDAKAVLSIGKDDWPFPIPIVKAGEAWRFDAKQGKEELLNRRIGRNELAAIQAVLAYVDAQRDYYLTNPQKDKLFAYAQRVVSTQGKRDGLYFPTKEGESPSPLGPLYASARKEGYKAAGESAKPAPYHGYYFRILKGQGPDAPGGAYEYVAQGRMLGGHALIAYPSQYGNSGIMTFQVNHAGMVYQKDLGAQTASIAEKITRFNPDKTWTIVDVK